jgi:hypothetical protein
VVLSYNALLTASRFFSARAFLDFTRDLRDALGFDVDGFLIRFLPPFLLFDNAGGLVRVRLLCLSNLAGYRRCERGTDFTGCFLRDRFRDARDLAGFIDLDVGDLRAAGGELVGDADITTCRTAGEVLARFRR